MESKKDLVNLKEDINDLKSPFKPIYFFKIKNKDDFFVNNISLNESKNIKNENNLRNSEIPTEQTIYDGKNDIKNTNVISNIIITSDINGKEEEIDIIEIKENKNLEKKKTQFGRKRARSGEEGKHNKYSDDNLRRKCKHIVLNEILIFINDKLFKLYNGNLGQGILIKKLYTLNHDQKANAVIKFNKDFLFKTLGEIFSENISSRYTNFPKDHNKELIIKLRKEKDDNKRIYFNNLFNLTFLDSLRHFTGFENIEELNGLKTIDEVLKQYDNDLDYKTCLDYYLKNFEIIIKNKKSRNSKKSDKNNKES